MSVRGAAAWIAGFLTAMGSLAACAGAAVPSSGITAEAVASTVLVRNYYFDENQLMSGNETGAVLDIRDRAGNPLILTARHGVMDSHGHPYASERGVQIYSVSGHFLGSARIAYCDPFSRSGDPKSGDTVVHDACVLAMETADPLYRQIRGYHIPDHLSPEPIQVCHDGILSWAQGSSGSPMFSGDVQLQGILSIVYNENAMAIQDWRQALADQGIAEPVRLPGDDNGAMQPVVHASCAMFVPPSPSVLIYLGIDPNRISWDASQPRDFPHWGNVSLPNFRQSYIVE